MSAVCKDPANILYWTSRLLSYSSHARERALERRLPVLQYLPVTSRLADVDFAEDRVESLLWKIGEGAAGVFLVVTPKGWVITTWGINDQQENWEKVKNYRRAAMSRASNSMGVSTELRQQLSHLHTNLENTNKPSAQHAAKRNKRQSKMRKASDQY